MKNHRRWSISRSQIGFSLMEVMIAVFIAAVGVLGAAAMQLNALKYTDSSKLTSQASFIVYDIIDRMRANADPSQLIQYAMTDTVQVPGAASTVLSTDLIDFANAVDTLPDGRGVIDVNDSQVTVQVSWYEGRAEGSVQRGMLSITTNVSIDDLAVPP